MKYKIYLARLSDGTFRLARGEDLNPFDVEGCAVVRLACVNGEEFNGSWAIIDVATGLNILRGGNSKKKLLEHWEEIKEERNLPNRIIEVRKSLIYKERCKEMQEARSKNGL